VPKYCYFCTNCEEYFDLVHSYKDIIVDCILCESKNTVYKFLGKPISLSKKITVSKVPAGKIVTDTIEEIKQEIKSERKNLKTRKK
jgi:hypothetical protein